MGEVWNSERGVKVLSARRPARWPLTSPQKLPRIYPEPRISTASPLASHQDQLPERAGQHMAALSALKQLRVRVTMVQRLQR